MKFWNKLRKIIYIIFRALTIIIFSRKNPVKLRIIIMITASLIFFIIWINRRSAWFPSILMLLFTGGILVIFIILSSFHPNEGTSKLKMKRVLTLVTVLFLIKIYPIAGNYAQINCLESIKVWFQNIQTGISLTSLILIYFIVFIRILKKEENSIRILIC